MSRGKQLVRGRRKRHLRGPRHVRVQGRIFRELDRALGLLTAAAPWLVRFKGDHKAAMVHLVVGGLVAIISSGELLLQGGHPPDVSTSAARVRPPPS